MRVLSIVHEPSSTGGGGLFEEIVTARGDVLARWVMPDGTSEPGRAQSYDAIMVFGGAMHPDQDAEHPWLAEEALFLREAIEHEVPLLGVCLGAQLIARTAGGSAADRFDWLYSDEELAEWVGPTRRLTEQADEVYALFNNNRDDFAPRSAVIFRGLLDEAGIAATGGLDLPPAEMTLF